MRLETSALQYVLMLVTQYFIVRPKSNTVLYTGVDQVAELDSALHSSNAKMKFFGLLKRGVEVFAFSSLYPTEWQKMFK